MTGMQDEIARELARLSDRHLDDAAWLHELWIAGGRDRSGLNAEALANIRAEIARRDSIRAGKNKTVDKHV